LVLLVMKVPRVLPKVLPKVLPRVLPRVLPLLPALGPEVLNPVATQRPVRHRVLLSMADGLLAPQMALIPTSSIYT